MKTISLFLLAFLFCAFAGAQNTHGQVKSLKSVIEGWKGWENDPDSVTIRIMPGPPEFSSEDSAAIRDAVDAWNDTDSRPKLKLITEGDPQISVTRNDTLSGAVGSTTPDPDWEHPQSMDVQIDTDDGQTTLSTVMHELGHCLGLDDTENADDVMYGYDDVECAETPSANDSTETRDAAAAIDVTNGARDPDLPDKAMMPNQTGMIVFPVGDLIPPDMFNMADCFVESLDPMIYVEGFFLDSMTQSLNVNVFSDPEHVNGDFYLHTTIILPERQPITFLGRFYVNMMPAPPVTFECPMNVYELDGMVHVDWVADCTYPFGNPLRSWLLVTYDGGSFGVKIKPMGNFILDLDPGTYTFTLYVNDFQVNSATSSMDYLVTGVGDVDPEIPASLGPNPFTGKCHIDLDRPGQVSIFDLNGRIIYETQGKTITWSPSEAVKPGIYLVRIMTEDGVRVYKVVYER